MATAKHGRRGRLYLEMGPNPTGTGAVSAVPMLVDWSIDRTTDKVDTTSCDSENKEYVQGFGDYKGQFSANMDADSDQLYAAADGLARNHIFYPDRDAAAGKRRYNYGPVMLDCSESGGVSAKLGQNGTFQAAGTIGRAFV
jgi:hypothetical protein